MDKKRIGNFLKQLRNEKNWSQKKMAQEYSGFLGLPEDAAPSLTTISKWENGKNLPNIQDMKDIANFYGVTLNELFNGERTASPDFTEIYLLSDENSSSYEIRENEEIKIETRFNELLLKLLNNQITTNEENEFDFLCLNFYTPSKNEQDESIISTDEPAKKLNILKFTIRKQAALTRNASSDEKLWDAYKMFDYKFRINFCKDLCDDIVENHEYLVRKLQNSQIWERDILLALIQQYNVTHGYGEDPNNPHLFRIKFGYEYNPEQITKDTIKMLIENGAYLNDELLGYFAERDNKINILEILVSNHNKYKKPLLIPVFDGQNYSYYAVENTAANRKLIEMDIQDKELSDDIIKDYEEHLKTKGAIKHEKERIWIGDDTLEESEKYMLGIIRKKSMDEYIKGRNKEKTEALLRDIGNISLTELRKKYFVKENRL